VAGGIVGETAETPQHVGQHATEAAGMLDHIGKAFDAVERQLTDELRPSASGSR
jgi:hypothetical protein